MHSEHYMQQLAADVRYHCSEVRSALAPLHVADYAMFATAVYQVNWLTKFESEKFADGRLRVFWGFDAPPPIKLSKASRWTIEPLGVARAASDWFALRAVSCRRGAAAAPFYAPYALRATLSKIVTVSGAYLTAPPWQSLDQLQALQAWLTATNPTNPVLSTVSWLLRILPTGAVMRRGTRVDAQMR